MAASGGGWERAPLGPGAGRAPRRPPEPRRHPGGAGAEGGECAAEGASRPLLAAGVRRGFCNSGDLKEPAESSRDGLYQFVKAQVLLVVVVVWSSWVSVDILAALCARWYCSLNSFCKLECNAQ